MRERYTITVEVKKEEAQEPILYVGLLDGDTLVEYQRYSAREISFLQRILIGKITEPVRGLNSYFVNIKEERPGYLQVDSECNIRCGDEVPVQIIQEGVGRKGHRLTLKYTIPGESVVLTPYDTRISISSKVEDPKERERLYQLANILPHQGETGYIVRTDAVHYTQEEILEESDMLYQQHLEIQRRSETSSLGTVLYQPPSPVIRYIRSLPRGSVKKVVVDDAGYLQELTEMFQEAGKMPPLQLFNQGRWGIREFYRLTTPLDRALQREVLLKDGGSLVIEETEAMVVIDVNSGGAAVREDREETLYQMNCRAAKEIAHQIRLRNLAGIIIVDFIDMKNKAHQSALLNLMRQEVRKDPRKTTVHGLTRLGLMEITRQRGLRPLSQILKD